MILFNKKSNLTFRFVLPYAAILAILLIAIKIVEHWFYYKSQHIEVLFSFFGIIMLVLGIYIRKSNEKKQHEITQSHQSNNKIVIANPSENNLILSKREIEVLQQIALGKSNAEIADFLHVSLSTVKTHIANIYQKLDVNNRVKALEKGKVLRIL